MRFGIGQPVTRKEDRRFLTGEGRNVADIDLSRQAHAVFVLSPHAHARMANLALLGKFLQREGIPKSAVWVIHG